MGIMEKKMETTGIIGIMENEMETTILYGDNIGFRGVVLRV